MLTISESLPSGGSGLGPSPTAAGNKWSLTIIWLQGRMRLRGVAEKIMPKCSVILGYLAILSLNFSMVSADEAVSGNLVIGGELVAIPSEDFIVNGFIVSMDRAKKVKNEALFSVNLRSSIGEIVKIIGPGYIYDERQVYWIGEFWLGIIVALPKGVVSTEEFPESIHIFVPGNKGEKMDRHNPNP